MHTALLFSGCLSKIINFKFANISAETPFKNSLWFVIFRVTSILHISPVVSYFHEIEIEIRAGFGPAGSTESTTNTGGPRLVRFLGPGKNRAM